MFQKGMSSKKADLGPKKPVKQRKITFSDEKCDFSTVLNLFSGRKWFCGVSAALHGSAVLLPALAAFGL